MATTSSTPRLTVFDHAERSQPFAAWWPRSRSLSDELAELFDLWPTEAGHIGRVLYSPPDWDDHPRTVLAGGRRVKTGCFPRDDTKTLTLTMSDRTRLTVTVIAPSTPPKRAAALMRR